MKAIIVSLLLICVTACCFADDGFPAPGLSSNENQTKPKTSFKRTFVGCDLGVTFGDYTEVRISPLIGYRFSRNVAAGLKFVYRHSWQKVNVNQTNQTTDQSNGLGGNVYVQYNPVKDFYLKTEFSYVEYPQQTTQNLNPDVWVPFVFLGLGYSQELSRNVFMNLGIKVDILNNQNSPFDDFTPFFDVGIGVGI